MNPILDSKYYIPDVEARQWDDGRVYLYGSMDVSGNNDYCSREYAVFSSHDMKNWTVHPRSFSSDSVHDASAVKLPLYAPDCERIHDRYCLFYCQKEGREGVAFSEHPEGPFGNSRGIFPADKDGIDPAAFADDDGKLYYFWGQRHARGGQLDLKTCFILPETLTDNILTEEEHGFHEGISIRKRNGLYYLIYSDISRGGRPTCLGYATSDHPLGPYHKRGIIIDNTGCDPSTWNNHGSICEINGQWYVFYHRSTRNSHYNRQVCVEPIFFRENGSIDEVPMTTQGADAPIDVATPLELFRTCGMQGKCYIDEFRDTSHCYEYVTNLHDGDCLTYRYLNFKVGLSSVVIRASSPEGNMTVDVCLDTGDKRIATVLVDKTAGPHEFVPFWSPVQAYDSGVHCLILKISGGPGLLGALREIKFQ